MIDDVDYEMYFFKAVDYVMVDSSKLLLYLDNILKCRHKHKMVLFCRHSADQKKSQVKLCSEVIFFQFFLN